MTYTTPPRASWERNRYESDILQPFKKNGHVNEKFVKTHGAKNFPDQEVKDYYKKKGY